MYAVQFKRLALALVAIVATMAVAACGSSKSSSASGGGGGGGASVTTAASSGSSSASSSGGTIKIMTLTIEGSPIASYPETGSDAQAAVAAINKAGGVNGKKILDIFCNTKGDVNQAETCAREAVSDHVVAAVGDIDVFDQQTMPILQAAKIPVVGEWPNGESVDGTSPNSYPFSAGSWGAYSSTVYGMKAMGIKKVALVSLDLPVSLGQVAVVAKEITAAGITQAGSVIKIPVEGVSDYAPYAQQLKSTGAQGAVEIIGPAAFTGIGKAAQALGIHPTVGVCEICGLTAPGLLIGGPMPLATDMSNPGIATFNKERVADGMAKVSPTDLNVYSGLNAWLAVHAFADVAKTIKGQVTTASLKAALDHTTNLNVEGLVDWSPSTFDTPGLGKAFPRFPAVKGYVLKVGSGGAFESTDTPAIDDPIKASR